MTMEKTGDSSRNFSGSLPEDGGLKPLKFSKNNICNTMIVNITKKIKESSSKSYQLATFNRALRGTGWLADELVEKCVISGLPKVNICTQGESRPKDSIVAEKSPIKPASEQKRTHFRNGRRQNHRRPMEEKVPRRQERHYYQKPLLPNIDIDPWIENPLSNPSFCEMLGVPIAVTHVNHIRKINPVFKKPALLGDKPSNYVGDVPVMNNSLYIENYGEVRDESSFQRNAPNLKNHIPSSECNSSVRNIYNNHRQASMIGDSFDVPSNSEIPPPKYSYNKRGSQYERRVNNRRRAGRQRGNNQDRFAKNNYNNAKRFKKDHDNTHERTFSNQNSYDNQRYNSVPQNYENESFVEKSEENSHNMPNFKQNFPPPRNCYDNTYNTDYRENSHNGQDVNSFNRRSFPPMHNQNVQHLNNQRRKFHKFPSRGRGGRNGYIRGESFSMMNPR